MSEIKKSNKKVGKTLLLDVKTMEILKAFAQDRLGSNSMSAAVRLMAREYEERQKENTNDKQ